MESPDTSSPNPGQRLPLTSGRRIGSELSCILCHRRKVKCNKQLPCSNCIRADVLCCYPRAAGEKHEPRKSRTTISAIVNRLGQIERTIVAMSSSDDQPANMNHGSEVAIVSREGKGMLLHDGYSAPYINVIHLSRVLKKVCFMSFL